MSEQLYYKRKIKIIDNQKLSEKEKNTKLFNLWIDKIFNNVQQSKTK